MKTHRHLRLGILAIVFITGCRAVPSAESANPTQLLVAVSVSGNQLKHVNSPLTIVNGDSLRPVTWNNRPALQFQATNNDGAQLDLVSDGINTAEAPAGLRGRVLRVDYQFDVRDKVARVRRYGSDPTDKHDLILCVDGGVKVEVREFHNAANLARWWASGEDYVLLDATTVVLERDGSRSADPPKRQMWQLKISSIEDCLNRARPLSAQASNR